jgi:NAD(P)-dependent dehydrogenase (short-subunit alcohol dehydrogenase family)
MGLAVITGANRGIGLELARQLRQRGTEVVAICRRSSPALDALDVRVETGCDVALPEAWHDVARRLAGTAIDLLVHNAGLLFEDTLSDIDVDDVRRQFELNAVAPLLMTRALLPNLPRGARVVLITSRMGSMGDNGSGGYYGYRMSKAALNAAGVSLAVDLKPRGVAVGILHPGAVRTDMTGGHGMIDPPQSVRGLLQRIDELTLENSGRFLHQNGDALPW